MAEVVVVAQRDFTLYEAGDLSIEGLQLMAFESRQHLPVQADFGPVIQQQVARVAIDGIELLRSFHPLRVRRQETMRVHHDLSRSSGGLSRCQEGTG